MKKYIIPIIFSIFLALSFSQTSYASYVGPASDEAEVGWERYLYDEVNITYEGSWTVCQVSRCTKNVWQTSDAKIKFNFVGDKFRFISYYYSNSSKDIDVYIDGEKTDNFSLHGTNDSTPRIAYESPTLESREHSVEIINNTKEYLYIVGLDFPNGSKLNPFDPEVSPPTNPEPNPEPKPEPEQPKGDRAILVVTMTTGLEKEFDLSMEEVNAFITWYESKQAGSGTASYAINKHNNNKGPFSSRKDYVIFDKILSFEVNEYTIK
ncbi:bacterial surface protein [Paenibacillus sp. MER TA 81-3]|uniref:bacterial surface protein n=1 Tax=Paenibacillus sp. MER TA 81-3 TaxID=2939573 RepID=UPI00203BD19B|nr:bacterial surface protein [Paenibacillus sp. MER TA 81-3]MCM3339219.1 bacterial surface protein [Paenibacillus sp. MER TA 81-3]